MKTPRFAFRSLDGFINIKECPDVSRDEPPVIYRVGTVGGKFFERRYERTGERYLDLPVYEERETRETV